MNFIFSMPIAIEKYMSVYVALYICQRLIMMKVWSAVAKQSAVWGIVFAWSATDLMWMLLETYVTVLNKINFMVSMVRAGNLKYLGTGFAVLNK